MISTEILCDCGEQSIWIDLGTEQICTNCNRAYSFQTVKGLCKVRQKNKTKNFILRIYTKILAYLSLFKR